MVIRSALTAVVAVLIINACDVERSPTSEPTTPGMDLSGNQRLLVLGDWGAGTESQRDVAAQMEDFARDQPVAAIVTTGDNFYSDDARELMEPFGWATDREIPFLITWGNHDIESGRRIDLVEETFDDPPRWGAHEWGSVDILVLDSTQTDSAQQSQFLVDAMADGDDPMIVVFHNPPLSCGSHGDSPEALSQWVPRFDNDVLLVVSGHEHNYQRFESDDVTYLVSGGGGQSLTDLADCTSDHPKRLAGAAVHHFLALELNDSLDISAIDSDGIVIDEFSLALP